MSGSREFAKQDRTARLIKVLYQLYYNPQGLKVSEIASKCGVNIRTAYRDLRALEEELKVPVWEYNGKRGVDEGYLLPPINFTLPEVLNIFLAARLMLHYSHRHDPNMASLFAKLNSIVPAPLKDEVQKTFDWMQKQPWDEKYLETIGVLAEAWISRHKVKISYQSLSNNKPTERIVQPYFIEPAAPGHASYLIAFCERTESLRIFKIERIASARITAEMYKIPPDFDANEYFESSWGIIAESEVKNIKLKFIDKGLARIISETVWHPSQKLAPQKDGSLIMTLEVSDTVELLSWILSWGDMVEVLEPATLRRKIIDNAKAMLELYEESESGLEHTV